MLGQDNVLAQQQSQAASPQHARAPHIRQSQTCSHPYALRIQAARRTPLLAQADVAHGEALKDGEDMDGAVLDPMDGIRSLLPTASQA